MSQAEHILLLLTSQGYVSNFECIEKKITYRLGARIFDLKKRGYQIEHEIMPNKDCRYRLVTPKLGDIRPVDESKGKIRIEVPDGFFNAPNWGGKNDTLFPVEKQHNA